jgi:Rap1a immunity proteins
MRNVGTLIAVMTVTSLTAHAEPLDVDKLSDVVQVCESAEQAMRGGVNTNQRLMEAGSCWGFVLGFLRADKELRGSDAPRLFCAPAPFKLSDIIFMFNAFLRKDPKWRVTAREQPTTALVAALQDAWPCSAPASGDR